jgi:hypothetical protein
VTGPVSSGDAQKSAFDPVSRFAVSTEEGRGSMGIADLLYREILQHPARSQQNRAPAPMASTHSRTRPQSICDRAKPVASDEAAAL